MCNSSRHQPAEKYRIGLFNSNRVWGGGEKWHFNTALLMQQRQIQVTLFAQAGCELIRRTKNAGIDSVSLKVSNMTFLNPLKIFWLVRKFRKLRLRVIILNLPSDLKFAGIAAKLAGVQKIIYRRGSPVWVRNTIMNRFLFRVVLTHIIANSHQIKRSILRNNPLLVRDTKISVIYNGIDSSYPLQNLQHEIPSGTLKGVVMGTAGRLSPEKGLEWLISMAGILRGKNLDFTLLVAGEGPLLNPLARQCKDLGLDDHIRFCGFIEDMESFYSRIDLFILTSAWEGCSNVILEAMHEGLPVVAFNNSSLPELITDGLNGFLVKNRNAVELAEKVELLIRDSDLRVKLGEAGRKIVQQQYDLNNSFNQLMDLIRQ